jgi:Ca2+-binding EF-hand superfamily protein
MLRAMRCAVPVLAFLVVGLPAADDKPAVKDDGVSGVVVKVDAKAHTVTLRLKDAQGKDVEKTFTLGDGVMITDETGKLSGLDTVQPGDAVVAVEKEGRLTELRRARREERKEGRQEADFPRRARHPADVLNVLEEMSDCDEGCVQELQAMYDQLRKLDPKGTGKIDPAALKARREQLIADRVDEIMKDLDTDKDGKISRDEARGMIKRDFDKIDLNKDGFIDRDELMKAAAAEPAAPPPEKEPKPPER